MAAAFSSATNVIIAEIFFFVSNRAAKGSF